MNQDNLENLFSRLRALRSNFQHPSPVETLRRLRILMIGQNHALVVNNPSVQLAANMDNQESLEYPVNVNNEGEDFIMDVDSEKDNEMGQNTDEEPDPSTDIECVSKSVTLSIADPLIGGQEDVDNSHVTIEEIESLVSNTIYITNFRLHTWPL